MIAVIDFLYTIMKFSVLLSFGIGVLIILAASVIKFGDRNRP